MAALPLVLLEEPLAIARLSPDAELPAWAAGGAFAATVRTGAELSIVAPDAAVPPGVRAERGWRALQVASTLDLSLTGILAALAVPLAGAGVSIFAVSTYDTDYVLVRAAQLDTALAALRAAGHTVA